jgi:hypothetical protein
MVRLSKPGCIQSVIAIALVSACAALLLRAQTYSGTAALAMRAAAPGSDSQPQQASSEVSTIREYSNLVVVDVVVTELAGQSNPWAQQGRVHSDGGRPGAGHPAL